MQKDHPSTPSRSIAERWHSSGDPVRFPKAVWGRKEITENGTIALTERPANAESDGAEVPADPALVPTIHSCSSAFDETTELAELASAADSRIASTMSLSSIDPQGKAAPDAVAQHRRLDQRISADPVSVISHRCTQALCDQRFGTGNPHAAWMEPHKTCTMAPQLITQRLHRHRAFHPRVLQPRTHRARPRIRRPLRPSLVLQAPGGCIKTPMTAAPCWPSPNSALFSPAYSCSNGPSLLLPSTWPSSLTASLVALRHPSRDRSSV